ncbi:MAG: hypothetical protein ACRDY3_08550 [Acidimicrobiales bacterium]
MEDDDKEGQEELEKFVAVLKGDPNGLSGEHRKSGRDEGGKDTR